MTELGMNLAALFTGVFGAAIGFILIAFTAVILALPYFLFTRPNQKTSRDRDRETLIEDRM